MASRTLLVAGSVLAVMSASGPASAASKDEDAIKARVGEFIALFNKGDARAMSAFFTDDATLVNPLGAKGKGPAEIEKVIANDVATFLKGTKMDMNVVQYRPVGKDAAWIEIDHTVMGAKMSDGTPLPMLTYHVPCLMVKKGKSWMIAEARPYAYFVPPPAKTASAMKQ